MAQGYVSSSAGGPTPAAQTYIGIARDALDKGLAEVNEFMSGQLAAFRSAVGATGVSLLSGIDPVAIED